MFRSNKELHEASDVQMILPTPYLDSVGEAIQEISSKGYLPKNDILIDGSGSWIATSSVDLVSSFEQTK